MSIPSLMTQQDMPMLEYTTQSFRNRQLSGISRIPSIE